MEGSSLNFSGPAYPGSHSGSPRVYSAEEQPTSGLVIDLDYGNNAYFFDLFPQCRDLLNYHMTVLYNGSSYIPGLPPGTDTLQFNECITNSALSRLSPAVQGQYNSPVVCNEDLELDVNVEISDEESNRPAKIRKIQEEPLPNMPFTEGSKEGNEFESHLSCSEEPGQFASPLNLFCHEDLEDKKKGGGKRLQTKRI